MTEGGTGKSLVCLGFVGGGGRGLPEQYNITRSRGGYILVQIMKNDKKLRIVKHIHRQNR